MPPLRVLVVDDNPDFVASQRLLLTTVGYACETAFDVPSGVAKAEQFRPHVVLFDLQMPGDGCTLPPLVRERCRPAPLFIAVTGHTNAETRQCLTAVDVHLCLTKPADPVALLRLLAQVVRTDD